MIMEKIPVIFLALARWDGPYSSTALSLARELSHTRPVFYIDNPFTWKDVIFRYREPQIQKRKKALLTGKQIFSSPNGFPPGLTMVCPPPVWPVNWLPEGKIYDRMAAHNNREIVRTIRKVLRKHDISRYILVNVFNPFYGFELPEGIRPDLSVYYSVDDISQSVYIQKHGPGLEDRHLQTADICLATSSELQRICQEKTSQPVYLLRNAANTALFNRAVSETLPVPPELQGESRPVIAYTGAIGLRIDYALLKKIAEVHRDKLLLMVGPKSSTFEDVGLDDMENVRFTGSRPLEALPAYLQHASCAIIPFRCNTLTKSIYPLKLHEYLAAGKSVVSTNFSPDVAEFNDHVFITETHTDFVKTIEKAVLPSDPRTIRKRMEIAAGNSWKVRVEELEEILARHSIKGNTQ